MYLDCAGMRRSGSTLQYNIVSEIFELKKTGVKLGWEHGSNFSSIKKMYEKGTANIFKNHFLTDDILKELQDKSNSVVFYVYRDIRDVCVSIMEKENKTFDQVLNSKALHKAIEQYYLIMGTDIKKYIQAYELMFFNTKREIVEVANFLNFSLSGKEIDTIFNSVSMEAQIEKIEKYKKEQDFVVKNNQRFNPKTLLHLNHIKNGGVGKFKKILSENQIVKLESIFGDWLLENNYPLFSSENIESDKPIQKYYSQHGEDFLLWEFFDYKSTGYFIEVGAFDGVHLSNTYSFELNNWTGICIEPGVYFEDCRKNRKGSNCLNLACVAKDDIKELVFFQEDLGLLSSVDISEKKLEDIKSRYKNRNLEFSGIREYTVECSTLNKILLNNTQVIDFVSIDVEGTELDVLKGFDLVKFEPKVVVVEANDNRQKTDVIDYMTVRNDYIFARELGVNLFFVRTKKDFFKLRNINVNCTIEKQLHPKGEKFTLNGFVNGAEVINGVRHDICQKNIIELPSDDYLSKTRKKYFLSSEDSPILIYQVGKVGSSTIHNSLKKVVRDTPIYQVHNINNASELLNNEIKMGHKGGVHHFSLGIELNNTIKKHKDIHWKIIIGIREPIKRWLSEIFQNMEERYVFLLNDKGELDKNVLKKYMEESLFKEPMQSWFQDEFEQVFGIDIFKHSFNQEKGYEIIRDGNIDILVYQLEKLSELSGEMFKKFLSLNDFELIDRNESFQKKDKGLMYSQALRELEFDEDFLNDYYKSNRVVQNFYSSTDITSFKNYWLPLSDSTVYQKLKIKENEVEKKNKKLQTKEAVIKARDKELQTKEAVIKARDKELQTKEAVIKARGKELQTKEAVIKARGKELQTKEAVIEAKDKELNIKSVELNSILQSKKYKLGSAIAYPYLKLLGKYNK